jgi:LL-diaminopimelate aminotransferase
VTRALDTVTLIQTQALRSLPPYVFSELDRLKAAARARGASLIDLGIGSPDIPMDPRIADALAIAAHARDAYGYPAFRGTPRYLESIGRLMRSRFGLTIDSATQALALSGAKEGIAQLIAALCGPGDVALIPEIFYPVYARAAWLAGAEVRWVKMRAGDGFVLDLDAIPSDDARRAKLLIVNYPNNPTGARVEQEFYERAVAFAKSNDLLLVSDLAYSEITFDGTAAPSALSSDRGCEATIEFHSCSKTFSMAGLRIGFAVGNVTAVEALAVYRTNVGYGTPTVMQHAAAYALDHREELVPPKVAEYRTRRDAALAALAETGWIIAPPAASMYLWLPVPDGVGDWEWVRTLIDEDGVVVTPGVAFGDGGRGWFRVSLVRDAETLSRVARTIAARRARLETVR